MILSTYYEGLSNPINFCGKAKLMTNIVTPEQVQQVIDYAQKVIAEAWEKNGPMPFAAPKVFADEGGKRYTRLITQDDNGTGPGRFAYGFIDMTNGDLLKA